MPVGNEANGRSQPAEGRPSEQRRRQGRRERAMGGRGRSAQPRCQGQDCQHCGGYGAKAATSVMHLFLLLRAGGPQASLSQASSHHGVTLPQVCYPERLQPVVIQQAQVGSPRESSPNIFPTRGNADGQAGGAGGSKLSPPCCAPQAAHTCRLLWEVAMDCRWPAPLPSRLWEQKAATRGVRPALGLAGEPNCMSSASPSHSPRLLLQMGSLWHRWVLLSTSQSRQEQTLHLPLLLTMAPKPPPRPVRAVRSCCRLPPVTPAASAASVSESNWAINASSTNPQRLQTAATHLRPVRSYGTRDTWLETCQPALLRSTVSAPTTKSSGNRSTVLCRHSAGSQGPCQQSTVAETQMRRDSFLAASSSKAPATQYKLRSAQQVAERLPAIPAVGSKASLNSKSLGLHQKVFPQRLPPLPPIKTVEQPKRSCLAGHPGKTWAPLPPIAPARGSHLSGKQEAAALAQRQAPAPQTTETTDVVLQATAVSKGRKPAALLAKEERQCVEDIENVLSHVKVIKLQNIWVNPLVPDLYRDPQGDIQAGPSSQSRAGTGEAGEAVEDLQSTPPVLAGPTGTEPAAATLAGAAEEERHHASLAAVAAVEEEAPAPASPGSEMQEAVAEGQRNAFDLLSPTAADLVLQEIARCLTSDILQKALAVIHKTDKQPQEELEDVAQSHVEVSMAAMRPAAEGDTETPVRPLPAPHLPFCR